MFATLLLLATACAPRQSIDRPIAVDAHVHVLSPDGAQRLNEVLGEDGALTGVALDAPMVVAMLDSARVTRAVIISAAYQFAAPELASNDEIALVQRENDWVAVQASRSNGRLIPFCSMNPLREYAIAEMRRCREQLGVKGVKLNFPGSQVDLRDETTVRTLQVFFAAADAWGVDIIAHIRTMHDNYGAHDVRVFVDRVARFASSVNLQIAHLGGWGGYDAATDAALAVIIGAFETGRLSRERTYLDLSAVMLEVTDEELVGAIERVGARNVMFASDWPLQNGSECRERLVGALKARPALFSEIARNRPRYLR